MGCSSVTDASPTSRNGASLRWSTAALDELEQTPTLVVFEDMHWADEATLTQARRDYRSKSYSFL
jgi:hypothetical protein